MIVVSDTSPVLNLAAIDSLNLLGSLYSEILIPPAVHDELTLLRQRRARFAVSIPATLPSFLRVEPLSTSASLLLAQFSCRLHPGEAQAMALAVAHRADLFLVDERIARLLAQEHSLRTRGLLGVLVDAKRRGLLAAVRPLLQRLSKEANFYMSAQLRNDVLRSVGEENPPP